MKFLPVFEAYVKDLRPAGGDGEFLGSCPWPDNHAHGESRPSFNCNAGSGLWLCHGCGQRGDVITFLRRVKGHSFKEAEAEVARLTGQAPEQRKASRRGAGGKIVATHDYHAKDGKLLFQTVREEPKDFKQRRPDGNGSWIWNLKGVSRVLYQLPELLAAPPDHPVFKAAGEKDADRLRGLGLTATTNPQGEGPGKWRPSYNEPLRGRRVVILADNDPTGRAHAAEVAASLHGVAASVKVLELPGLPEHGDVSDFLAAGGTREDLLHLAAEAPEWRPPQEAQGAPQAAPPGQAFHLTDLGNAQRLVARHGHDLHFCWPWSKWLVFDGRRWAVDAEGGVWRMAKETARSIYAEAAQAADPDRRAALAQHAARSESAARLGAMIDLARSEPGVPVLPENLDTDAWALNCLNGALNLRTGELCPHRRAELLTKLAPVEYNPQAACPTFESFLERIFAGNLGLIEFVQRAAGYSLTGSVRERKVFVPYGRGRNGKTTFQETMHHVFGDYAQKMPAETLLAKRDATIPNDVARLKGARYVSASEVEEGRHLGEATTKALAGADTLCARYLHGEWFDFTPTHKIWLATNHRPVVRGTDDAIWDRLLLVPFEVRIPEAEQDTELLAKLKAEGPGILFWAVRGCLEWQRIGLSPPEEVIRATGCYRQVMDVLGQFMEELCVLHEQAKAPAGALYKNYVSWCEGSGEKPLRQRDFGQRLAEQGLEAARGKGGVRLWRGIGLQAVGDVGDAGDAGLGVFPLRAPNKKKSSLVSPTSPTSPTADPATPGQGGKTTWRL